MNEFTASVASERELPLVAAQPGIWVADQLTPHPNAYAVAHYVELDGELNLDVLRQAIAEGLAEVDTLRMVFEERDGVPTQRFNPRASLPEAMTLDMRHQPDPHAAALAWMQADLRQDLRAAAKGLQWSNVLLRTGEQRWCWYQRYHHLALDGYSFAGLTRRIAQRYSAAMRGAAPGPSPWTPFERVVEEYQAYEASDKYQQDRAFWQEKARQLPPAVSLSPAPLGGQVPTTQLLRERCVIAPDVLRPLIAAAEAQRLSAADVAVALVGLWLSRLGGLDDFTAGFIFMRRLGSAAATAAGAVINVLPMQVQVRAEDRLLDLAATVAKELKTLRRRQRYEAEQIQRDLGRVGDAQPLYGAVINLKLFDFQLDLAGVPGTTHALAAGPVRDLEITLYLDQAQQLTLEVLANAERYEAQDLARHVQRFGWLARQFAADPQRPCQAVDVLDATDHALLAKVNDTTRPLSEDTLVSLLRRQAELTPGAPALSDAEHQLDYRQVREQVVALAQHLVQQGVRPGDTVAVAMPRSVFLSVALMAILEVGAAYLPLDSGYPDERLALMLEDASPRLVLASADQAERLGNACVSPMLRYDALLQADPALRRSFRGPSPASAAYIIYTSGSTGRPKGVVVGHQAIVNRLQWMQHQYPIGLADVVLQKTPSSFDVSVWEFFWPLMVGARLHMAPPEAHRDPDALQRLIEQEGVTTMHFVPSMLAAFVATLDDPEAVARCRPLRQVFCSGEALPTELCRRWERRTGVALHNLYGPTEAAVDVSWYPAHGAVLAEVSGASVPIGFAVWNTGLRILDRRLRQVPPGVAGDLYLTGVQLAHGYLGRAELTASRFVGDPYADGQRMYRTGDVARWLANGAVEYLGRSDDQLKIRGQRIELSEIDHALLALPGVAQAVTHARVLSDTAPADGGDARQLVGYVIAQPGVELDLEALRGTLADRLPAHMVPVALVPLDAFPLGATGKLDRKALPLPNVQGKAVGRAPAPGLEQRIAEAFGQILGRDDVHAEDDFFALGGHSLLAMTLAATLRRTLERPVAVGQVMIASSVERLARLLETQRSEAEAQAAGTDALLPLRPGKGPTLFCFHPASGFAWQFSVLQRYIDPHWALVGIQSPRGQDSSPPGPLQRGQHLDDVCEAHLALVRSVQPHGPYHFLGYSLGGTLAHGIAARLRDAGEEVAFLGLLDTYPPETQNWDERAGQHQLDPEVLAEVNREREQFLAAQRGVLGEAGGEGGARLFEQIEANYGDAVRLLATARSVHFAGTATLYVAEKTLPLGMDVNQTWGRFVDKLAVQRLDCAHVDIISPVMLAQVGPMINRALKAL